MSRICFWRGHNLKFSPKLWLRLDFDQKLLCWAYYLAILKIPYCIDYWKYVVVDLGSFCLQSRLLILRALRPELRRSGSDFHLWTGTALLLCSSARRKIVLSWLGSWTKNLGWPNWALFLLRCFSSPGKDRGTIVCLHCSSASLGQGRAFFSAIVPSEQLRGYSGAVHSVYGPNLLEHRNIFQVVKTNYFVLDQKVARQDIEWQLLSPTETANPTSGIFDYLKHLERWHDWNPISCCRAFLLNIHRFLQRQQV